ncbi:MAG: hypothetical protein AB7F40_10170 [Victivallaceae bacterium]|nr:hypothetical protein [Victivallaceae bacterium]
MKKRILATVILLLGLCNHRLMPSAQAAPAAEGVNANQDMIRWWPRIKPAVMPDNLTQLAVLEISPSLKIEGEAEISIQLPDNVRYAGCPTAWINPARPRVHAIPFPETTAYAADTVQNGNLLTMRFPAGSFGKEPQTWLPLLLEVNGAVGIHTVPVTIRANGMEYREDIALDIRPALSGAPCRKPLIIWDYQGVDEKFLPIFINGFVKAGFNRFYEGREELPGTKSAVDFQNEFGTGHGVAFSPEAILEYYKNHPLPAELAKCDGLVPDCGWMVDHPAESELLFRDFFNFMTSGKTFKYVILDCERGAFKSNGTRITNDLSPYNLRRFAAAYGIEGALSPEIIAEKYRDQWIEYCCKLSCEFAALLEPIARKLVPSCKYEIYSGYQFQDGETKRTYAVDWEMMKKCGMDAAGAGYFGSYKDITATADAIRPVPLIPAEMFLENFMSTGNPMPRLKVEVFAYRLIQVYLWSGCNGMQIWHGGVLTGPGLVSVDIFKQFVNATCDLTDGATRVPVEEIARVSPRDAVSNVYCFQKDGKAAVIVLNPSDTDKTIRLNFRSNQAKPQTLKLAPYSYKVVTY